MKHILSYLFFVFLCLLFPAMGRCQDAHKSNKHAIHQKSTSQFPTDMVLIYHGGNHRPDWNMEQMRPYVYRMKDNQLQWLFDGFLFLEINTNLDGVHYDFVVSKIPAGKKQWEWLLKRTFAPGLGPDAIEELLDSLENKGFVPPSERKVVISIPNPFYGSESWGELKGKPLDFHNTGDRVAACRWYVNQVLRIWKKKKYNHLTLAGFYWVHEATANESDANTTQEIKAYLQGKNLNFYWIPYNGAGRAGDWSQLGFDIAYQQPNYFFRAERPYSLLSDAIEFSFRNKMALEMEFDNKFFTKDVFRNKFYDYINEFKKRGVWDHTPVAYYEGGGTWLKMSQSKDPVVKKAFRSLGDVIAARQKNGLTGWQH